MQRKVASPYDGSVDREPRMLIRERMWFGPWLSGLACAQMNAAPRRFDASRDPEQRIIGFST